MSGAKPAKKKQSFWQTLRAASGSYRRLYGYVKPYKVRFIVGLAFGLAYGGVNSLFPLAIARVTSTIFHGAAPSPMAVGSNLHALDTGPKINSIILICLAISSDHDCAQPLFLRKHLLHAVGEQQGGDAISGVSFSARWSATRWISLTRRARDF